MSPERRTALRVIMDEQAALSALAQSLDAEFERVVALIISLKGRVIVSGMGKSGHIGRKIAATLASTGTLAMFLHPAEASHGDLGMVSNQDTVIALSNSGETAELSHLVDYCRRYQVPLVALTAGEHSTLAKNADYLLRIPRLPEAGEIGLAPTVSTTMMLALGDALALTLMEARGFTHEHFSNFHPGGKLGQALLRVERIMHAPEVIPVAQPDTTMDQVILRISKLGFGCAAVVDAQQNLLGTITDGDLRRHMGEALVKQNAASIMTRDPVTARRDTLVSEALATMNRLRITSLFVVTETGKLEGLVHVHDCLRAGQF